MQTFEWRFLQHYLQHHTKYHPRKMQFLLHNSQVPVAILPLVPSCSWTACAVTDKWGNRLSSSISLLPVHHLTSIQEPEPPLSSSAAAKPLLYPHPPFSGCLSHLWIFSNFSFQNALLLVWFQTPIPSLNFSFHSLGSSSTFPVYPPLILTPSWIPLPGTHTTRTVPSFPAEAAPHMLAWILPQPFWKSLSTQPTEIIFASALPSAEMPTSLHCDSLHCHFEEKTISTEIQHWNCWSRKSSQRSKWKPPHKDTELPSLPVCTYAHARNSTATNSSPPTCFSRFELSSNSTLSQQLQFICSVIQRSAALKMSFWSCFPANGIMRNNKQVPLNTNSEQQEYKPTTNEAIK